MWAMVCSLGLAYLESPSDGGLVRVLRTGWEIMLGRGGIVSAGLGVRVVSGWGAGRPRWVRPGWCWRCCCGWWGGTVNRVSCYMFARWCSDTDFSA